MRARMHALIAFGFGFGGDQFPVRIARRHVAGEGPHVGDVGDLLGIAVDDVAVLVARHRHQLGLEAHGHLDIAAAHFGGGDLGIVDRHETALHRLAALLALGDGGLEAVIDLARQQILQRAAIAFGIGVDDHLVGRARAGEEMLGVEIGSGGGDRIEAGGDGGAGLGDALPALDRLGGRGRRLRGGFRRAIGQGDDFFRRRPHRLARGIRIVRRALAAGALAEHAAQAQEDEHCERQEYDGVDVEHVSHAFGYRSGRSAFGPSSGVAAGSTRIM